MIRTILLDAGGVLVYPLTGTWLFPRNYHAIMDKYLATIPRDRHMQAIREAAAQQTEAEHMYTEDMEAAHLRRLYALCYREILGMPVTDEELDALAIAETYDDDRYALYDDVLPMLRKWQGEYRIGLVSDTLPSLRRSLLRRGVLQLLETASLSCDNGVVKPGARMYRKALEELDVPAETAVFVDDLEKNLLGARENGILAVRMLRSVYTDDPIAPFKAEWDGPTVHSLTELDELLPSL